MQRDDVQLELKTKHGCKLTERVPCFEKLSERTDHP